MSDNQPLVGRDESRPYNSPQDNQPIAGQDESRPYTGTFVLSAPDETLVRKQGQPSPVKSARSKSRPYIVVVVVLLLVLVVSGAVVYLQSGGSPPAAQPTPIPRVGANGVNSAVLPTAPPALIQQPTVEPTAAAFVSYYSAAVSRPDRDPDLLPTDPFDQRLSVAYHNLQLNGHWEQAVNEYRTIIADPTASLAARREAYWRVAQCNFLGGSYARAIDAYAQFQQQWPTDERSYRADYIIADAYNYLTDYGNALKHWQAYLPHSGPLYSFTLLRIGASQVNLSQYDAARHTYSDVVNRQQSSDRERSAALEGVASMAATQHDYGNELAAYESLLTIATDKDYRADLEYRAALAMMHNGDRNGAFNRFLSVIHDYPDNYRAYGALQQMLQVNASLFDQGLLDYYTAGLLAYNVNSYQEAIGYFADYLNKQDGAQHAAALLYAGLSYQNLGNDTRAIDNYTVLLHDSPTSPEAVSAHYRVGELAERRGACSAAVNDYAAAASHLDLADGRNAGFHLGLCRYKLGDNGAASDAWQPLTAPNLPADVRAQAYFWLGRDAATTANDATNLYKSAIAAQPGGYYAYRAAAKLAGEDNAGPVVSPARLPAMDYSAMLVDAASEEVHQQDYATWLAGWAHTPLTASLVITSPASLTNLDAVRALSIARVGERIYAKQELDYALPRLVASRDALNLAQMALYYRYIDEPYLSLLVASKLAAMSPDPTPKLPTLLGRSLYATPFTAAMIAGADQAHTSPLLLYAITKQESYFNPLARSSADARGLTQVLPSTAAGIAANLGDSGFTAYDLYRPYVAARYGAAFLTDSLANQNGSVLRSLAAYNAGPGSLPQWSNGAAASDGDLFVENISYAETADYVRIVYTNYAAYLDLYSQK